MNPNRTLLALLAAAACIGYATHGLGVEPAKHGQAAAAQREKVVFQMSDGDPRKWNLALNNAKNVQDDLGAKNVEIEIAACGPGIGMIKPDSEVANRVGEAIASGVRVVACENTMTDMKLKKAMA